MAESTVKIYGFVNDTALFNREFSDASTVGKIDQGACCITDKIRQMFGNPKLIEDPRAHRCSTNELMTLGESYKTATTDLKTLLQDGNTHLLGKMSIMIDEDKLPGDTKDAIIMSFAQSNEKTDALWSYIEILGNHQMFESDEVRGGIAINRDELVAAARGYAAASGAEVVITEMSKLDDFVENIENTYFTGFETPSAHIMRYVRKSAVIKYLIKDSKNVDVPIELHLFWGATEFLNNYPLTTITDVIMPCERELLYEILDNFGNVSDAIEHMSEHYRNRMNEVVLKDDHTGVADFKTNYYGYPDTQPSNTFPMTFSVVYKGARPTIDEIKERLRIEILNILPKHSEEEWRKKLPGIIANRQFFMIPIYDNVWWSDSDHSDDTKSHRKGIFDLTRNAELVNKYLNSEYLEKQLQYVQIVSPKYSKYPVLVVPHIENPSTSRLISDLYPDYMGLETGAVDETGGKECDITQSFTAGFNATLANAARNQDTGIIKDFDGTWCHFSPLDGSTYYILSKNSYLAK